MSRYGSIINQLNLGDMEVATFYLALTELRRKIDRGKHVELSTVCWRMLAEFAAEYESRGLSGRERK